MLAEPQKTWQERAQEENFQLPEFVRFQNESGVDFHDLLADDRETVVRAQRRLTDRSVICHEIRKDRQGFTLPLVACTHELLFGSPRPYHNPELDRILLAEDLIDSLRRRHVAMCHALLPSQVQDLTWRFREPLTILNLGSGIGLDTLSLLQTSPEKIGRILNFDNSPEATQMGRRLALSLARRRIIPAGRVEYLPHSLAQCREKGHLVLLAGVICELDDPAARAVLRRVHRMLPAGGRLLLSTLNHNLAQRSPLSTFLLRHLGSNLDPAAGMKSRGRSRKALNSLLAEAGFRELTIYDDLNFPGRAGLAAEVLWGVDPLAATGFGLPPQDHSPACSFDEVSRQREGCNWLAVVERI